jgi:hypothetical protein
LYSAILAGGYPDFTNWAGFFAIFAAWGWGKPLILLGSALGKRL